MSKEQKKVKNQNLVDEKQRGHFHVVTNLIVMQLHLCGTQLSDNLCLQHRKEPRK